MKTIEDIREDLKTQTDPVLRNLGEAIVGGADAAKAQSDEELVGVLVSALREVRDSLDACNCRERMVDHDLLVRVVGSALNAAARAATRQPPAAPAEDER